MGCNYYAETADGTRVHVGKSSAGWSFLFHVVRDRELVSLADWRAFLDRPDVELFDCEDRFLDADVFFDTVVLNRDRFVVPRHDVQRDPSWQWANHAFFDDVFKVARPVVGGRSGCIRNGDGPYDFIVGEFS